MIDKEAIKTYPFNLINAIFRNEDMITQVFLPGLDDVLETLSDREQKVLGLRFKEKLTLKECGPIIGVSGSRISQIEYKALRKLRHPVRANRLLSIPIASHNRAIKMKDVQYEELLLKYKNLKFAYESISHQELVPPEEKTSLLEKPIEDLGLSVRSYNCLKRRGLNKIKDITGMTIEDLSTIRNLGTKSMEEVLKTLHYCGLRIKDIDGE